MAGDVEGMVQEAVLTFATGRPEEALALLREILARDPGCVEALLTKAEVLLDLRRLEEALVAAEKANAIQPDDVHIHTTLSRIHMERGDKTLAEQAGAQARVLGWKEVLRQGPSGSGRD